MSIRKLVETSAKRVQKVELRETTQKRGRVGMTRWIQENLKIVNQSGKLVPFRLNKFQRELAAVIVLLERFQVPIRIIILKSRKLGFSTLAEAVVFYRALLKTHRSSLLLAHTSATTSEIFKMTSRFYTHLCEDLKPPLTGGRESSSKISLGSPCYSEIQTQTAGVRNPGRGMTPLDNHYSEFAFWQFDVEAWTALETAVPGPEKTRDSMIIVESTANGTGNHFHKLWRQSYKPKSPYDLYKYVRQVRDNWDEEQKAPWIGLFYSWTGDPDCSMEWVPGDEEPDQIERDYQDAYNLTEGQLKWARFVREERLLGSWEQFHQEYPVDPELAFKFSGYPYFHQGKLKAQMAEVSEPIFRGEITFADRVEAHPELEQNSYGNLVIWEHPKPGFQYAMGCDFAEGVGADYTEMMVLKTSPAELVAYYHCNTVDLIDAAVTAYLLGMYYNWSLLGGERNSIGMVCIEIWKHGHIDYPSLQEYPFIYHHEVKDKFTQEIVEKAGFQTNKATKKRALTKLRKSIAKDVLRINSPRVIEQLQGFSLEPIHQRYQQKHQDPLTKQYNDDAVMALAIAEEMRHSVMGDSGLTIMTAEW